MFRKLKKRQKEIIRALIELGGEATTRQVAEKTGFNVNGVAQTLSALPLQELECLGGKGGEVKWKYHSEENLLL